MKKYGKKKSILKKAVAIIEVALCVILSVFVVVNVTLIIKSYVRPDKVPDFFGYKPFIVLSGSMEPEILVGDLVVTKEIAPEDITVGNVISYRTEEDIVVTHRVMEVLAQDGPSFLTKGDANEGMDASAVSADEVEGLYIWRAEKLGRLALFIQTPLGMLVFVVVPMLAFIVYNSMIRGRNRKKLLQELEQAKAKTKTQAAEGRDVTLTGK